jgi:hypothetical protein
VNSHAASLWAPRAASRSKCSALQPGRKLLGDSRAETGKQNFRDEQRIEVLRIKVSRVHISDSVHERLSRALVVRTLQGPFHRGRTSWAPTRRSALHQLLSPTSRTFPGCYWLNTLTATSKGIAPIVRSRPKLVVRIVGACGSA